MINLILEESNSEFYYVLFPLALILVLSKVFSLGCKKIGFPQVVGMLLTGIVLGLLRMIPWVSENLLTDTGVSGISFMAEIGVILIMFSAGIETDVKQIKATGVSAIVITLMGVFIPMGLGFLVSGLFNGWSNVWSNLFYGVILTATSVSVTVATLKELGKLNSKVGTAVISAAILDDVIGVVVLSVILSLSKLSEGGSTADIWIVIGKTIAFFIFVFILGYLMRKLMSHLEKKYPHHRRLPIYALAFCFMLSFLSEKVFGIADITGAYAAGLILAGRSSSEYVERRTDIASYILFTPAFFAKIGITTDFKGMASPAFLTFAGFGLCFVLAGILGKLIGCGLGAKLTGFHLKDSYRCGLGMMCRAEVCLICASKGVSNGLVDPNIQTFVLILIVVTSFLTPLLLKLSYKKETASELADDAQIVDTVLHVQQSAGTISKDQNESHDIDGDDDNN